MTDKGLLDYIEARLRCASHQEKSAESLPDALYWRGRISELELLRGWLAWPPLRVGQRCTRDVAGHKMGYTVLAPDKVFPGTWLVQYLSCGEVERLTEEEILKDSLDMVAYFTGQGYTMEAQTQYRAPVKLETHEKDEADDDSTDPLAPRPVPGDPEDQPQ